MTDEEKLAITWIPERMRGKIAERAVGRMINEIRLRSGSPPSITSDGCNVKLNLSPCTADEIKETVMKLCRDSLYSYSDTIREGFIPCDMGIRAGVVGKAVTEGGRVLSVYGITSVNIRIPHRCPGAAREILKLFKGIGGCGGILIWSPPGIGKTTVLREFILSCRDRRISVIDSRGELCPDGCGGDLCDVFSGYPRSEGMEIAVRTMSPEIIVCDELSTFADCAAVKQAFTSGVSVVASCHSGSRSEVIGKDGLGELWRAGVFAFAVGLLARQNGEYIYDIAANHEDKNVNKGET